MDRLQLHVVPVSMEMGFIYSLSLSQKKMGSTKKSWIYFCHFFPSEEGISIAIRSSEH
jgi:hypothetical protein